MVALTKSDKLSKTERQKRLAAFCDEIPCGNDVTMIPVSSQNGEGIEQLKSIIAEVAED